MAIFPKNMLEASSGTELTLDSIKAKLNYFELQVHELHWQTFGLGEHQALGNLYETIFSMKDEIVEKMMGYSGVRTKAAPVEAIKNYSPGLPLQVVLELMSFAKQLQNFGANNNMPDIENIAQSLSGAAAQVKYRLTLS